ncbi:DUF5681 domain-containing protein [Sphingomonas sp. ERG5]|uniref:DUF5681 domain-containing protein n=1 Tax=Sphingomonas sp. ERG5 TaxID=1381597 RepID=UPI000A7B1C8E|nr:DUF5681 domain-containing protein [Sphingomonas sp. ERG5]
MTMPDSEVNRAGEAAERMAAGSAAPGDYAVGHGKPPVEHRFKKGNRANPGGKKRKVRSADAVVPQLALDSFHEMLMAEARRMVRVKAGGRMVEIPALQSAFREVAMKAARGNRLALTTMAQLVMRSDAAERAATAEPSAAKSMTAADLGWAAPLAPSVDPSGNPVRQSPALKAAEEYQALWTLVLTRAATLNAEIAAPVPHPDDVIIARVRGTAHWPGSAPDALLSLDQLAAMHAELQADLPARRPAIDAMAEGYDKAIAWCDWFALNEIRALIAENLPRRYANQIEPDRRPPDARARGKTLRALANSDRQQHEHQLSMAAARARMAAEDAARGGADRGGLAGGEDGEDWQGGEDRDGTERAAHAVMPIMEAPLDPAQAAAEASIYRAAWLEVLDVARDMEIKVEAPMPPPDDVTIDAEAETVTYPRPPAPGQRATLTSLRATLARLKADAARHQRDVNWATRPFFAELSGRRRDQVVALCAVIERHLGGGGDG